MTKRRKINYVQRFSKSEGNVDALKLKTKCVLKKRKSIPDIKKVEKDVLECIVGQDEKVRQIITAIYRAIHFRTIKSNLLIIGNSGTGKTETIKQIAKRLNLAYTIEDATKYTKEGYVGADVNEMVLNLFENANYDFERAKNGIIIIDEIDKKTGYEKHDVSTNEVLKSLLKIIEGTQIKLPIPEKTEGTIGEKIIDFDTSNIIVIFLGAFSGLDKIRDKRLNINILGFSDTTQENGTQESRILKRDLIKYGMPEEFVGRIDTIVEMNTLTKHDLALILRKSKLSIFNKYKQGLLKKGIELIYSQELFERIAQESMTLDTGARELSNTVNYMFQNIIYDVLVSQHEYTKCTLDLDIVHDNTKYKLS